MAARSGHSRGSTVDLTLYHLATGERARMGGDHDLMDPISHHGAPGITPAEACIQFALSGPGVVALILNSSHPDRVAENIASVERTVPNAFWASMKEEGLLAADYPHLAQ